MEGVVIYPTDIAELTVETFPKKCYEINPWHFLVRQRSVCALVHVQVYYSILFLTCLEGEKIIYVIFSEHLTQVYKDFKVKFL